MLSDRMILTFTKNPQCLLPLSLNKHNTLLQDLNPAENPQCLLPLPLNKHNTLLPDLNPAEKPGQNEMQAETVWCTVPQVADCAWSWWPPWSCWPCWGHAGWSSCTGRPGPGRCRTETNQAALKTKPAVNACCTMHLTNDSRRPYSYGCMWYAECGPEDFCHLFKPNEKVMSCVLQLMYYIHRDFFLLHFAVWTHSIFQEIQIPALHMYPYTLYSRKHVDQTTHAANGTSSSQEDAAI